MPLPEILEDLTVMAKSPSAARLGAEAFDLAINTARSVERAVTSGSGESTVAKVAAGNLSKSGTVFEQGEGTWNTVLKEGESWLSRAQSAPNPYLSEYRAAVDSPSYRSALDIVRYRKAASQSEYIRAYQFQQGVRYGLTHKYSWAIPNSEALATLAEQGKIVEAGAGSGYWASRIKEMGGDIVAFDRHGSNLAANRFHKLASKPWTDVIEGTAGKIHDFQDRTLFLSWPPDSEPFAHDVLSAYTGKRLVYVGEGRGGITGDYDFHDMLDRDWNTVKTVKVPNWESAEGFIDDAMHVFERK